MAYNNNQNYKPRQAPNYSPNRPSVPPPSNVKIDELNYVDKADEVIQKLRAPENKDGNGLTTSKIRNLLSLVSELQTEAKQLKKEALTPELASRVQYLKMRMAYEAGRDKPVMEFVKQADLLRLVSQIGNDRKKLLLFCNYMEALVAYHKFHGGRDN